MPFGWVSMTLCGQARGKFTTILNGAQTVDSDSTPSSNRGIGGSKSCAGVALLWHWPLLDAFYLFEGNMDV